MNTRIQLKTLVRLVTAIVVVCVASTLLIGPPADAAGDGYGVTSTVLSANGITEARSTFALPGLE